MSKKKPFKAKHGPSKPARKPSGTPRRPAPSNAYSPSQPATKSHFSLQDEARLTGGRQSFWNIDTKLRNRSVKFVSAGMYSSNLDEDKENDAKAPIGKETKLDDPEKTTEAEKKVTEQPTISIDSLDVSSTSSTKQPSTVELPTVNSNVPSRKPSPLSSVQEPDLFFIDTSGDAQTTPTVRRPHIRSPSPAKSDSSDEVIFHGRSGQARVVDDPVAESSTTADIVPTETSWDDTSVEWVHRSKPGVGWSVPKADRKVTQQPQLLTFRMQKQQGSSTSSSSSKKKSAVDDYLENIQEHDPDFLASATFAQRNIDADLEDGGQMHQKFQSLSVSGKKSRRQRNEEPSFDDATSQFDTEGATSAPDEVDLEFEESSDLDAQSEDMDDDSEMDGDDDEDEDGDDHDISNGPIDDETLAILLSKQEELGLGSDELFLFSESVDASVARAAKQYDKEKPKKSQRAKGSFPSASLMADVLEQDPYGGFDVMDFERPSLRKKRGKGKADLPFNLSDEELQQTITEAWENDRSKKKSRKLEREELRMQGLLGKDLNSKYGEGMTIWQIGKEFESFLGSDELQEKAFPPMDKRRRKMIHEIATEFNVKTKSVGAGNNRYTKIIKTKTTTRYLENRFVARARKINMGFFPRLDAQAKGKRTSRPSGFGGNSSAVRYQDGDVVGGAAPEIGIENKGRAMLEKMGWTSGTALGTLDNKGILEPIAHIVKNSKSGLG